MHASTCKLKGELFSLERFIDVLKLARRHDKTSAAALTPSSSSVLFVHRVWSTTQFLAPILKSCGPKTIFLKRKRNKKDHKYIKGLHVFYKLRVKLQKKKWMACRKYLLQSCCLFFLFFLTYLMFFLAFYKLLSSCSVWSRTWCMPMFSSFACDRFSVMKSSRKYII